jgi:hypothetical protein
MSWHDYNDSLVERGRILFELDFTSSWKNEVETMNREKVGRPYGYRKEVRMGEANERTRLQGPFSIERL